MYLGACRQKFNLICAVQNKSTFIKLFLKTLLFLLVFTELDAQVSGTIFNDYNGNGTKENTATFNENGTPGATVNAFDPLGAPLTVSYTGGGSSTNNSGGYSVSGGTLGQIRLEFILPDGFTFATNGAIGGTSVMFPATSTQNLAVNVPADYCQSNPLLITNCYVNGNQSVNDGVLVSFPYSNTGLPSATYQAEADEVGTTWGIAYNKTHNKVFTSAFIKRHSGLGSGGIGAIYEIDPSGLNNPSLWLDVESFSGVDVGSIGSNAARGLGTITSSSTDATAFDKVGKEGIGDIDLSEDGKTLYVMNLFQKTVLVIDVATKTLTSTINIADPGCGANGTFRPFATKFYRGELYIGIVCSGESSGIIGNFFIQKYSGGSWVTLISNTLSYPKGWVHATYNNPSPPTVCDNFESWISDFTGIYSAGSSTAGPRWCRPQPILSDIEFDVDGSMIIGFIDRTGHQLGYQNSNLNGTQLGNGYVGGDILRAYNNGSTFVLENGGTTLAGGGCGANGEGPGGGEFYCGERYPVSGATTHEEIALGGLTLLSGSGEVLTSAMDPGTTVFAGGLIKLSNSTGLKTDFYQLFSSSGSNPSTFGKAAGIGDIELLCNPAPIEIGNRVWVDLDADGVQDAGEAPIQGVEIQLYADFDEDGIPDNGTPVATTTTDPNGNWYFNESNVPDGDPFVAGNQLGLQIEQGYVVQISSAQYNTMGAGVLNNYYLTSSNIGGSGQPDVRDNDGVIAGGLVQIPVVIGGIGENNHSYDIGFIACNVMADAGADVTVNCTTTSATLTATGGGTYEWSTTETTASILVSPSATTTYTVTVTDINGCTDTDEVLVTVDQTAPTAIAGADVTVNCTTPSATLTASGGGTYLWSNGATLAVTTVSPTITTTYTVTVTAVNGCTDTDDITVTVDQTAPTADAGADVTVNCNTTSATLTATGGGTYQWNTMETSANITVSPLVTTTYTVTVTAANGCTDTDEVQVTVDQTAPTANAGADVTVNCTTPSATLTATGGGTYEWSTMEATANITVSPLITTTYTVTVTSSNGCTNSDEIIVTADKTAIADAGADVTVNCTTISATLTATGGGTYEWSTMETTASIIVTPLVTTTYTVTVTNANGCTDTDDVLVTVDQSPPTANAGPDVTVSCASPNTILNATGGGTYLWSTTETTATINVSPTVVTTYTVTVTAANGCTDTDEVVVFNSCFDVALTKVLTSPINPVKINDNVTYTITVYNQGTNPIDSIAVVDYIPSGYTYNGADNPTWTGSAPTVLHTATIGNGILTSPGILAGASYSFNIILQVNGNANASNINNFAEISSARDTEGNENNDDIDSTPDTNPNNDAGGQIGSSADNFINGNGTGTPGNGVAATDEDDHDGATVRIVDLALTKTISPTTPPPYMYGNNINFVITVYNQGLEDVQNIEISDYLPEGFSFVANNGWTQISPTLLTNTIAGPLAAGASTTLNLTLTLEQSSAANAWVNVAEISEFEDLGGNPVGQYDFDSTPDANSNNDAGGQPNSPADDFVNGNGSGTPGDGIDTSDEDDHDPSFVEVFDLAIRKTLNTAGPYNYGQTLTFTIEVFNQGNVPATNIVVNDYVPNGYTYSPNNGWTGMLPSLQNTISGPLNPGASTTLTLDLVLQNSPTGMYINYAEIATAEGPSGPGFDADSAPGSNTTGENGVGLGDAEDDDINVGAGNADQDDHDPAGPAIFDLALRKEVVTATPSYSYGQNVMYQIILINQGSVPATNISVIDHFPCGFEFDMASSMNVGWTQSGNTVSQTYTDTIAAGATDTLYIDMIVRPCYIDQNNAWTNYAEITGATDVTTSLPGVDIDSTPDNDPTNDNGGVPDFNGDISGTDNTVANENGDEDDHDPHKIQVFDLALRKVLVTPGPHTYGQLLTFEIEIFNQGNVIAEDIDISDYIPVGYTFAPNNGWIGGPSVATLNIAGPLAVGDSTTVTLQLTLVAAPNGGTAWNNYVEVTGSMDDKGNNRNDDADSIADSNPNNDNPVLPGDTDDDNILGLGPNASEDQDDHDVAAPAIVDLALAKTIVSAGPYQYGTPVTFRVTVTNQGNLSVQNIAVSDYLPVGFTFVANNGWTQSSPSLLTNIIVGPLAPGANSFVDLILTPVASAATNAWLNIAEIASYEDLSGNPIGDDDIDSTPDTDPNNDGGGNPDTASDDAINGDGTGMPGDTSGSTDEDDHDPALLPIHDVALIKTSPSGTFDVGDLVTFNIIVTNQGNHALDSLSLIDYISAGYSFAPNNNWTTSGANAVLTATISNGLLPVGGIMPQGNITFPINLTIAPYASIANLVNVAEVTGSSDVFGLDQDDEADSAADTNPNNDAGGVLNTGSDDVIVGDGTGMPGDTSGSTDEDDSDPATILLNYYSIGNQVWSDANNNGVKDVTETPISGVTVELYYDNPATMMLELVGTTTTDMNGLYLFDTLSNGDYVVVLPSSNFSIGAPFENYVSSTGSGANNLTSGVYEDPSNQVNANNNTDYDDNGVKDGLAVFPGAIVSNTVTLGDGEPTGENPDNDPNTLDSNENLTIDFGLVPLHSIGNQVWVDINNNGIIDGGEAPMNGIEVVLHYVDPVSGTCIIVGTVMTDANGYYLFDSLIGGEYIVEIPSTNFGSGQPLDGFASSTGNGALYGTDSAADPDDNADGDDNGLLNGNPMFVGSVVSDTLTLGNSEPLNENPNNDLSPALDENSNLTVDFGFVPMMSIGNQVWNDANNNGLFDAGETPISGVEVVLHYINPNTGLCDVLYTTTTDGNGYYLFSNLIQGSYIVELPGSNFATGGPLEGTLSSTGSGANNTLSGPNENTGSQIDPDNNTDGDDNGVLNGNAMFPGSVVSDTLTLVWNNEPTGETPNNDTSIATDNNSNLTVDFGFFTIYSIGNQVWSDANNNGIKDASETLISGVTVELYYDNPATMMLDLVSSTLTDMNGLYLFDSLLAGDYVVVLPSSNFSTGAPFENYVSSTGSGANNLTSGVYEDPSNQVNANNNTDNDDNGVKDGLAAFPGAIVSNTITLGDGEPTGENPDNDPNTLDSNENLTIDFGLVPLHSIGNQVWVDINNNGIIDGGEAPINGVDVVLHYVDPVSGTCIIVGTVMTNANGYYLFDSLIGGEYIIEIPSTNFSSGQPLDGFASSTGNGALYGTDSAADPDDNADGDDNGLLNGNPMFIGSVVSDTLTLGNNEPLNENPDNDLSPALDENSNLTVDFGFVPMMSIGNQVWNDANNNGLFDAGETPISGVEVVLHYINSNTGLCDVLYTTTTDGNGYYLFSNLIQGSYIVELPGSNFATGGPLEGTTSSTGSGQASLVSGPNENPSIQIDPDNNVDGDDNGVYNGNAMFPGSVVSDTLTLVWNNEPTGETPNNDNSIATDNNNNLTVDFGFTTLHSVGNQVWLDTNFNGIKDGLEAGVSGVDVEVHYYNPISGLCELISTTMTDANGLYLFDSLLAGQYIVVIPGTELQPGGPLQNYLSSTGSFNAGGVYEAPGVSADTNIDNDDNGTFNTNPMFFFGVVSDTISLGISEPVSETPNNDTSGAADQNSNLSVDFGFIPKVFDLALTKTKVSPAQVMAYGDVVEFDLTIFNQGNLDAENVVLTDYIPDGFILHSSSIGWTMVGSNAEYTITSVIPANASTVVKIFLEVKMTTQVGGYINYAEISEAMDTLGNSSNPSVASPYGVLVDIDSTPDDVNGNDAGGEANGPSDDAITGDGSGPLGSGPASSDEDDHDVELVQIVDIAMRKTVVTPGPYVYGQAVTYRITVYNQGNVGLYNVKVNDYIPAGMAFTSGGANIGWTLSGSTATYTIAGPIAEQSSVDVFITLVPQAIVPGNNATTTSWLNKAEISSFEDQNGNDITSDDVDSDGDNDPNNDPTIDNEVNGDPNDPTNPNDEDDHDEEFIEIFDLAVRKSLVTATPYEYNDVLTFNIEVFNQGNVPATNIVVRDYLPIGYTFVANNGWTGASPIIQNIIAGPIMPGGSTNVTLELTLIQTNGGTRDWINYSEIASGNGPNGPGYDADSTPGSNNADENSTVPAGPGDDNVDSTGDGSVGSQDDHDPAGPSIFDLALRKEVVTATPSYSYGQSVMYKITVFNQGNAPASNIVIKDYLPCGLTFNGSIPANSVWTLNGDVLTRTYSGTIEPGQNIEIFVDLIVSPCYTDENNAWNNFAEISSATDNTTGQPGLDIDSTPDDTNGNDGGGEPNFESYISGTDDTVGNENGDEDDHDGHKIQVFDLALTKIVDDRGPYMIGETATFRITVYNQGNVSATNILVNDYIRSGFTFPANPGWNMVLAPTATSDGLLTYLISSELLPGESIEIPLNLVVALDANPAVTDWYNYAEVGAAQDTEGNNRNDDADSTPNSDSPYENQVEPDGPWDNVIDGNGQAFNADEDDHDPEKVIVVGGLGDTVWKDNNGNGIQNIGEQGVAGVVATLTDCNGNVLQTTVTDNTGFYFFNNLIPGNYQVQFDISGLAPGCDFTYQNVGNNDRIDSDVNRQGLGPCVYINGGQFDSTYDAGLLILAAIGDFVWHDLNGNGQQNAGEPGLPGTEVNLYMADSTLVATTYTDINGRYLFDFLYPGDYFILFVAPEGYEHTFSNRGSDATDSDLDNSNGVGTTAATTLSPGERDMTWDAGFYKCIPIGDLVWYDINQNDIWDTNENGINGLRINLWRNDFGTWSIWDHTFTGNKPGTPSDDGYFKFCAPPGQYYIEVIMPPLGLVRARANVGNIEEIDSDMTNSNGPTTSANFTVISGNEKCDLGAGFYPQAQAGNLVWIDENLNGVQEDNESRIEGVKVEAIQLSTGDITNAVYTDMDGIYNLDYLEKQEYFLRFTPPAGYGATVPRATNDDADSDVDHTFGPNTTRSFVMNPGDVFQNIDMGLAFGVLPVDWLEVNAKRVNDIHEITWSTAKEVNVSHYVVERRLETDRVFKEIPGQVKANGNTTQVSNYQLNDLDVDMPGIYIYRVKQVDFDGQFTYSRLVKVSHSGSSSVDMYPNPAKNTTNVQVVLSEDAEVSIELFDVSSKLIKVVTKAIIQQAGDEIYSVDLSDIVPGIYNVIIHINGVATQRKLIRIE